MLDSLKLKVSHKSESGGGGPIDLTLVDGTGVAIIIKAQGKRADDIGLRDLQPDDVLYLSLDRSILPAKG